MAAATQLTFSIADKQHGYEFGCEGLITFEQAGQLLAGASLSTVKRLVAEGHLRKGKMPGRRIIGICKRSVHEYIKSMEQ